MPNTVDTYIHRIGRTGRAKSEGEAFTFSVPDDDGMIRRIEKILGETIERRTLEDFDYSGFNPSNQHRSRNTSQKSNKNKRNPFSYSAQKKAFRNKKRSNSPNKSEKFSDERSKSKKDSSNNNRFNTKKRSTARTGMKRKFGNKRK